MEVDASSFRLLEEALALAERQGRFTIFSLVDALKEMPAAYECYLVETEFWGAMTDPNLMVEINDEDLSDLIAATTFQSIGRTAP